MRAIGSALEFMNMAAAMTKLLDEHVETDRSKKVEDLRTVGTFSG